MADYPSLLTTHDSRHGGGPVLDADIIQGLQDLGGEDDPGLLLELIDLFLDDAEQRVAGIETAIEQGDIDSMGKLAHALKSASANLGALGFSKCCSGLEHEARDGNSSAASDLARATCAMYSDVRAALTRLRQEAS